MKIVNYHIFGAREGHENIALEFNLDMGVVRIQIGSQVSEYTLEQAEAQLGQLKRFLERVRSEKVKKI
jgi:hypothetical protein